MVGTTQPAAFALYRLLWNAVDWLYPPSCGGCNQLGFRWCQDCQQSVHILGENICSLCGDYLETPGLCPKCRRAPPTYCALRSWGVFAGSLRVALHRLKYQKDIALGEALSHHLVELLDELNWPVDLITAVPLSKNRLQDRGYNQAGLLAFPMALACRIPYTSDALSRVRETRSQVGLSAEERLHNVKGAFEANASRVNNKTVLVVDDVTTTGATLQACAEALLQSGARQVYGLTLARALSVSDHSEVQAAPDASTHIFRGG